MEKLVVVEGKFILATRFLIWFFNRHYKNLLFEMMERTISKLQLETKTF
jgi:hypothetical protein